MGAGKVDRGVHHRLVLFFRTKAQDMHGWVWMRHKMQRGGQPAAHSQVVFYFFNGGRWPGLPGYLGRRGLAGFAQREMGRRANPVGISVPYLTQVLPRSL